VTNSKHPRVGGNQMYIFCSVCGPEVANTLMLAERPIDSGFTAIQHQRSVQKFLDRHAACGGTRDKFKLALGHPAEWDAVEFVDPTTNLKGAVRLALVKP
jgi:hypothetical protein